MQTVINPAGQPIAVAGQGVDTGEGQDDVTRINSEASANIGFGLAVKVGTKDHSALMLSGGGDTVDGVVLFDYNHSPGTFGEQPTGAGHVRQAAAAVAPPAVAAGTRHHGHAPTFF